MTDGRWFVAQLPPTLPKWFLPLLGTKFLVTVMAMTGAMLALAWGWIGEATWLASLNLSAGSFLASNVLVTNSAIRAGKTKDDAEPATSERGSVGDGTQVEAK